MINPRIAQADQIVTSLLSPTLTLLSDIAITEDNKLVIITDGTILYTTYLKDVEVGEPIGFTYNLIGKFPNIELSNPVYIGNDVYNNIMNYYTYYINSMNASHVICNDNDLLSNSSFDEFRSMKAGDGMKYFSINNKDLSGYYFIPMLPGLVKLNKGDTASVNVYCIDKFILSEFIVFKKKISREIHIIYKSININR